MARNVPQSKPEEVSRQEETATQSTAEIEVDEELLGMSAPTYGVVGGRKKPAHVPVMKYRVEPGPHEGKWSVVMNGGKTFLAGGKIIDSRQYDIDKLRLQGVKLTEIGES